MTKVELEASFLAKENLVKKDKKIEKKSKSHFFSILGIKPEESQLNPLESDNIDIDELDEKLDEIISLGEKLKKRINIENISNYKSCVKKLLSQIIKSNFSVKEVSSGQNIFVRKQYTLVNVIDVKLNDFISKLLQNQLKQIEILASLEEIQGLLVNLLQ